MDPHTPIEEAKVIDEILKRSSMDDQGVIVPEVFLMLLSGMLAETLIEYEEPDAVMEQSFHRMSQLLHITPIPDNLAQYDVPSAIDVDRYTEIGREMARESSDRLPKGLDAVHEILIAIAYNELPVFEKDHGFPISETMRIMIECVIQSVVFEMACQDFVDRIIEDFMSDDWGVTTIITLLGAACGEYYNACVPGAVSQDDVVKVMSAEVKRFGGRGSDLWTGLNSANDDQTVIDQDKLKLLLSAFEEFFDVVGFDQAALKLVSVSKTAGRMLALVTSEDMGFIQPSLAKMLLKSSFVQAAN